MVLFQHFNFDTAVLFAPLGCVVRSYWLVETVAHVSYALGLNALVNQIVLNRKRTVARKLLVD